MNTVAGPAAVTAPSSAATKHDSPRPTVRARRDRAAIGPQDRRAVGAEHDPGAVRAGQGDLTVAELGPVEPELRSGRVVDEQSAAERTRLEHGHRDRRVGQPEQLGHVNVLGGEPGPHHVVRVSEEFDPGAVQVGVRPPAGRNTASPGLQTECRSSSEATTPRSPGWAALIRAVAAQAAA